MQIQAGHQFFRLIFSVSSTVARRQTCPESSDVHVCAELLPCSILASVVIYVSEFGIYQALDLFYIWNKMFYLELKMF